MTTFRSPLILAISLALTACGDTGQPAPASAPAAPATTPEPAAAEAPARVAAVDAFLARLGEQCGQAFEGRIVANEPPPTEADPFEGKTLVMHVRECGSTEMRIPFHVGDDRSRTWVLTRTEEGLRLKHDHRHEDGSDDAVTMYGGDTADSGTPQRQAFPIDAFSVEMFQREGLTASLNNTWAIEIEPGSRFLYELSRPTGRLFQVEFDLSKPVDAPLPPWGSED